MKFTSTNVAALSNALRPLFKVPADGGAITIEGCSLHVGTTGGTTYPTLVDLGTSGTAVDHTLADGGTIVLASVQTLALSTNPVVEAGHWVGVKEGNVGALAAVSIVGIAYNEGK